MSAPDEHSARRSTILLAAVSGVAFALSLLRSKMLAIVWGPVGVGQLGLMQAAMGTATLATGLGVDGLMAREVAATKGSPPEAQRVLAAATVGAAALSLGSAVVSTLVLALYLPSVNIVGLAAVLALGVGAGFSVLGANFKAVLSGLGAAREIAISTVVAAVLALAGTAAIALTGASDTSFALVASVVPATSLVALAVFALRRTPPSGAVEFRIAVREVIAIARRATIFTAAGILPLLTQSMVRTLASSSLSETGLGQMQAASTITAITTSLLASSIMPVLMPQLVAAVAERRFSELLSRHSTFLLSLYAPVAVFTIGIPALVLATLYSSRFTDGAGQLSWQIVGEVVRLPLWLMSGALLVLARGRAYFAVEATGLVVQVAGLLLVLPYGNSALIGVVFMTAGFAQFLLASALLHRDGFAWSRAALLRIGGVVALCAVLAMLAATPAGMVLALVAFIALAINAVRLLLSLRSAKGLGST